uniref:Uncharacterized protein n=1 Tax=Manihot esculenta TaxID=3983 RepID=A0A2C9UGW1_MANES
MNVKVYLAISSIGPTGSFIHMLLLLPPPSSSTEDLSINWWCFQQIKKSSID